MRISEPALTIIIAPAYPCSPYPYNDRVTAPVLLNPKGLSRYRAAIKLRSNWWSDTLLSSDSDSRSGATEGKFFAVTDKDPDAGVADPSTIDEIFIRAPLSRLMLWQLIIGALPTKFEKVIYHLVRAA